MLLLMLMYTIGGGLLTALSIPLILGKIGPNPWYGFRVKKTLNDPAIWYPANAYAGKRLFVVGLSGTLIAAVLYIVPNMDTNTYAWAGAVVIVGGLIVAVIQSFLYLRRFPSKP
jgi:SdpI/YhfL family protein